MIYVNQIGQPTRDLIRIRAEKAGFSKEDIARALDSKLEDLDDLLPLLNLKRVGNQVSKIN